MSTSSTPIFNAESAEDIRREMARLRCQLREDLDGAATQAKDLVDWKHYVRQSPWLAAGVATLTAYAMVPGKPRSRSSGSTSQTSNSQTAAAPSAEPKAVASNSGFGSALLKTVLAMAVRTAVGVAAQKAVELTAASAARKQ